MPKEFERCPCCTKKGLYLSNGYPHWGDGTKVCRYCGYFLKPRRWPPGKEGFVESIPFGWEHKYPNGCVIKKSNTLIMRCWKDASMWEAVKGRTAKVLKSYWDNGEGWYKLEDLNTGEVFESPDVFWREVEDAKV